MTVGVLRPVNFSNCEMLRAMSSKGFKTICREGKSNYVDIKKLVRDTLHSYNNHVMECTIIDDN